MRLICSVLLLIPHIAHVERCNTKTNTVSAEPEKLHYGYSLWVFFLPRRNERLTILVPNKHSTHSSSLRVVSHWVWMWGPLWCMLPCEMTYVDSMGPLSFSASFCWDLVRIMELTKPQLCVCVCLFVSVCVCVLSHSVVFAFGLSNYIKPITAEQWTHTTVSGDRSVY